jgi:2-polyprenyl-6-hydroxyphenyl methylase/3-demethylubiquinone-9 3-methyltransferase
MDLLTDVRDWLGGWPMEFVLDQEVVDFVEKKGFTLTNIDKGKACTEFMFIRK